MGLLSIHLLIQLVGCLLRKPPLFSSTGASGSVSAFSSRPWRVSRMSDTAKLMKWDSSVLVLACATHGPATGEIRREAL